MSTDNNYKLTETHHKHSKVAKMITGTCNCSILFNLSDITPVSGPTYHMQMAIINLTEPYYNIKLL